MKRTLLIFAAAACLLAGCNRQDEQKVASLQAQVKSLEELQKLSDQRNETLQDQVTDLDGKRRDAQAESQRLALELERTKSAPADTSALSDKIEQLEAEIERLKKQPAAETPTELPVKPPEPEVKPEPDPAKPDPEVVKQLENLLPLVKGGDIDALNSAMELIYKSDKGTRDDFIASMHQWVKEEPENKRARLSLAAALSARFQDLTDPMKMGALAGQVATEAEKALEIDPEYYDAVHFLAILKVNYPTFTPEFKQANVTIDKALAMQADMTWEDRFADMYAAYGMWYRMQKKYDDASAWVQKGLDKAPRDQGLLNEQAAIEQAKTAPEEG